MSPAKTRHQGVGRLLLERLVRSTEAAGIWTIQTGIFPENEASVHLHRARWLQGGGARERLGRLNGAWRDVLLLERRSKVVGQDKTSTYGSRAPEPGSCTHLR